ncbi:6-aminohexanoate hydrolase, partial [Porticoccaceae bacterium]|nr:6-aminohexanoate hydrolase [Porticoccaceae bacterium]
GVLRYINWLGSVDFRRKAAEVLDYLGIIELNSAIKTPVTYDDGTSKEFFENYQTIIDSLLDISRQ